MDPVKECMKKVCTAEDARRKRKHGVTYKLAKEGCKILQCNPTCKNTSFGTSLKLSKKLRKLPLYKKGEAWRLEFEKRRRLFGRRKNILKNGFYVKLSKKEVEAAKKRGEISGCHD
jgi:GR25 family glycosyltransferase involved in LPS biosynthesis